MAEQFYTILTSAGKALIANAGILGTKISLTNFALGDGNGNYYNPTEDQVSLKNEVWRGQISSISIDEINKNWINIDTILPSDVGGFTIREAAIFDTNNNMIAIGKYPETYKPLIQDGSIKDLTIRMILEITNSSVVTLKVDPTVMLATKVDVQNLENQMKNIKIPTSANDIGAETPSGAQDKATAAQTAAQNYTDTKLKQLIATAPGALDTLKELADALGDDPNFSTTVVNLIGTKANAADLTTHLAEKATQNQLGHVQLGSGINVDANGIISTDAVNIQFLNVRGCRYNG